MLYKPPRLHNCRHYRKRKDAIVSLPRFEKLVFSVETRRYVDCVKSTPWVQDFIRAVSEEIGPTSEVRRLPLFSSATTTKFSVKSLISNMSTVVQGEGQKTYKIEHHIHYMFPQFKTYQIWPLTPMSTSSMSSLNCSTNSVSKQR